MQCTRHMLCCEQGTAIDCARARAICGWTYVLVHKTAYSWLCAFAPAHISAYCRCTNVRPLECIDHIGWVSCSLGCGGRVWGAVAFCGPIPAPAPLFPISGSDTNKRIRSPRFRQTLHSRQSSERLSVTLNDKSANLCQSLWEGIPVFGG